MRILHKVFLLCLNIKTKSLDKILVQIFNPTPPWKGGMKNEVIEKLVEELKLQNMNFRTHKREIQKMSPLPQKLSELQDFS